MSVVPIWRTRVCPQCNAQPDENCRSATGKIASLPHKVRWPEDTRRRGGHGISNNRRTGSRQASRLRQQMRRWHDRNPNLGIVSDWSSLLVPVPEWIDTALPRRPLMGKRNKPKPHLPMGALRDESIQFALRDRERELMIAWREKALV